MGFREWADRQVRKRDVRRAIEETHFQIRLWEGLTSALKVTEHNKATLDRFDDNLREYMDALISGLRENEARLWGFKGNPVEWNDPQAMIVSGLVKWDEDKRERLILADVYLSDLRIRLTHILDELQIGHLTASEARATVKSEIASFHDGCLDHCKRLEDEAISGGLANQRIIEKHKRLAEKRVGAIIGRALS
ncbi:MAG: hypothetical protein O2783_03425 [Chloroflexi bacterium]|nr:hypothetical protein [Chloroflexota bacterium]